MEKSNVEEKNVKNGETNNGEMNEFFGELSADESVYRYFRSDSMMSFNGENEKEDNAWKAMNEHGYMMKKEAKKTTVNVKKLLAKLVIENLENVPMSLHDLSGKIIYGEKRENIGKMSKNDIEKILFFNVLPELEKINMIKMSEALILGGGTETIYHL